jgi:hypothetical protein
MHLNVFVCTLFAGSKPVKAQTRPNRTGTDPAKNQTSIGLVPRWQKPDRTEPFRGVDLISFYLQCDNESMLLIELKIFIWRILSWQKIHIIEDLLTMRTRQLQRRNENMNEAKNLLKRMRKQKKQYFDSKHFAINKNINKNDLVLLHDIQHENDRSINRKLKYKWRESFRIKKIIQNKEIYLLQKLDEIDLIEIFVENKIKKFHQKQSLKISSPVSSNSIMNDHEFINENDVMKKIFDSQSLMFEEWSFTMIIF